jgi:tetratricopeptide (TPR) repeat protein
MFSIVSTLTASLARASTRGASLAPSLRAIQGRNLFQFLLPLRISIEDDRRFCSLSGRVRSFSFQTHKTDADPSLAQGIVSPTANKVEKQGEEKEKINYLDKAYKEEQKGNFELAEKYFTLAILEETRVAIAGGLKSFRGSFYRRTGQFDKAIQDFKETTQEIPNGCYHRYGRASDFIEWAYAYRSKGEPSKEIEILQEGIKSEPNEERLHYELGEVYLRANNAEIARGYLEQAVNINDSPRDRSKSEFISHIGKTVSQLKNCTDEEVPALYARLLRIKAYYNAHPKFEKREKVHYWHEAGEAEKKGDLEQAEKYYILAVQEAEEVEDVQRGIWIKASRGNFYRRMGQFDKSIEDYRGVIQEEPYAGYFIDLAHTYLAMGEHSKAMGVLYEGIKADHNADAIHFELAEIYLKAKNTKLALMHLEELARVFPGCYTLYYTDRLPQFVTDIEEIILQLKNCKDEEGPAIYAKFLEAKIRLGYNPF